MIRALLVTTFVLSISILYGQHTFYLIGDAGEPWTVTSPMKQALQERMNQEKNPSTVLFLGDNVYPRGLVNEEDKQYNQSISILNAQVDWVKELKIPTYFIPGNHDWQQGRRRGFEFILNQQNYIRSLNDSLIHFKPEDGCPGPVEISMNHNTTMVIIDTQWFLHAWDKPDEESECECKTTGEVLNQLRDILIRNRFKRVVIAAHHPIITYGEHGGVISLKGHLFPLTQVSKNLYVPLPVVGSIYPLYRKFIGNIQDTAHPKYKQFSQSIEAMMQEFPGTIFVSGHEHALEFIEKDSSIFIVSGAGIKSTFVKKKGYAKFAKGVTGFTRLEIQSDGSATTEFYQVDDEHPKGLMIWSTKNLVPAWLSKNNNSQGDSIRELKSVKVKASNQYHAGKGHERLFGKNYRDEWETEIDVPVFDIGKEKGGLKIIQKGGGMQTLSLRLQDSTGRQWVLRSIEKYPENAVPENLRNTFAADLVQDQISAAHPYGAFVIAPLAEAAGIYHTNPKLVFIPDDPRFGIYQYNFANRLALFEERPADDVSDLAFFGNSKKIISTPKVIEKLADDNDNKVDEEFVLRSRLFDIWIGDWDRHDDQWRWATFETKKGNVYRPIPRDRDQVFFVNEGRLAKIWSRKWSLPKFEGFDNHINWVSGLSFNARYFDRSFLTELTEEQWIKIAEDLQHHLTDDVIENAIKQWPKEIYELHGEKVINTLKARRGDLVQYAIEHYKFLAKEVSVVGSDKDEFFEITNYKDSVLVKVFKLNKEKEHTKELYNRTFFSNETKEVRLYGLEGDDVFNLLGNANSKIKIRVIGGKGKDVVQNDSKKRVFVYDKPKTSMTGKIIDRTSKESSINEYNRKDFKYDRLAPLLYGNFNPDDGIFLGGGLLFQNHGFRKNPFKQRHIILASIAPRTNSYNITYRGNFTEIIGKWSGELNLDVKSPNFVNNFFGLGNETEFNKSIDEQPGIDVKRPIDYYRFRFEEYKAEWLLTRKIGSYGKFEVGGVYQQIEIEEPDGDDRFIYNDFSTTYEYNRYGGLRWDYTIDHRDNAIFTRRGVVFNVGGRVLDGLTRNANSLTSTTGSISFYQSFRLPARITYALRVGGGYTSGNYNFYQAQILDGKTELRGFRKTRFYGDSKLYFNNEIRLRLLSFKSYLFPATLGLNAFYDVGRVWYKDSTGIDPSSITGKSNLWHKGFGGGVWFTPFNVTVLSTEVGHSTEGTLFYVRLGFLF